MSIPRRRIVVDPQFQYREALVSSSVAVLCVNLIIIGGTLFPELLGIRVGFSEGGYLLTGVAGLLLLVGVWLVSLRRTHALVGPLHAIVREVSKLKSGNLAIQIKLRPGDEFQHEAQRINEATGQLRDQLHRIKGLVADLKQAVSEEEMRSIRTELSSQLAQIKTEA